MAVHGTAFNGRVPRNHAVREDTGSEPAACESGVAGQIGVDGAAFQPEADDPCTAGPCLKAPHGVLAEAGIIAVPRAADNHRIVKRSRAAAERQALADIYATRTIGVRGRARRTDKPILDPEGVTGGGGVNGLLQVGVGGLTIVLSRRRYIQIRRGRGRRARAKQEQEDKDTHA